MTRVVPNNVAAVIGEFIEQLKALSGARPIPAHWRDAAIIALGPKKKPGALKTTEQRDIAIAHRMLLHSVAIKDGCAMKSRTAFAGNLG